MSTHRPGARTGARVTQNSTAKDSAPGTRRRRPARTDPRRLDAGLARRDPETAAKLAESRVRKDNPLRRVKVTCCLGWRRDADATVKSWVWCEEHGDWARVIEVQE